MISLARQPLLPKKREKEGLARETTCGPDNVVRACFSSWQENSCTLLLLLQNLNRTLVLIVTSLLSISRAPSKRSTTPRATTWSMSKWSVLCYHPYESRQNSRSTCRHLSDSLVICCALRKGPRQRNTRATCVYGGSTTFTYLSLTCLMTCTYTG